MDIRIDFNIGFITNRQQIVNLTTSQVVDE